MKTLNEIKKDIKEMAKGEFYEIKSNKARIEIGRCVDIEGYILRGWVPVETLYYEKARRPGEVLNMKQLVEKIDKQFA